MSAQASLERPEILPHAFQGQEPNVESEPPDLLLGIDFPSPGKLVEESEMLEGESGKSSPPRAFTELEGAFDTVCSGIDTWRQPQTLKPVRQLKRSDAIRSRKKPALTFEQRVSNLQLIFRRNRSQKLKLHRKNLMDRILFEESLVVGSFRLLTQCLIFCVLVSTLYIGEDLHTKKGILDSLSTHFELDSLAMTSDTKDFVSDGMKSFADRSKDFFALSSLYFAPQDGSVELLGSVVSFTTPQVISRMELSVQLPSFTFTAWVRAGPQFVSGYIVRKRIVPAGEGEGLSCWGWHLSAGTGPALHYGAQDFFSVSEDERQHQIGLPAPAGGIPKSEFDLLTMVVSAKDGRWTVTFHRNLELLGSAPLPRPVTDCFNHQEGVLVGDAELSIGQLTFHPRALSPTQIEEILRGGATLEDISTGSKPAKPAGSELETLGRALAGSVAAVEHSVSTVNPDVDLSLLLADIDAALKSNPDHPPPPAAAPGLTPVDPTLRTDASGREYTLLLEGPVRLTEPEPGSERYFDPEVFPRWGGRGMAITLWYRQMHCMHSTCGTYIISAHPVGSLHQRCWSAWLENEALYFDYVNDEQEWTSHYAQGILPKKYQISSHHWRHITFVFDEDTDELLFYQDGELVYKTAFGSSVREADSRCDGTGRVVTFGGRFPGWTYGREDDYYDFRMYVGKPLTQQHIQELAFASSPQLWMLQFREGEGVSRSEFEAQAKQNQQQYRCTPLRAKEMMDSTWTDVYGHGCEWYYTASKTRPRVCLSPEARAECPVACTSLQECFPGRREAGRSERVLFSSIRRIEARSPAGTICLSDHLGADAVLRRCEEWMAGARWEEESGDWRHDLEDMIGRRVNFTSCEDLAAAINPHCAFDSATVRAFTEDVKQSNGDYTIAFWVKPLGDQSFMEDGRFTPHLGFVSTISPPQHQISFGQYKTGLSGEVRSRSRCVPHLWENVEIRQASSNGWTFVTWSRLNSTANTPRGVQGYTVTNSAKNQESAGTFFECLINEEGMFEALEINYPMLISPILMVPEAIPTASIQELYYKKVNHMKLVGGPIVPEEVRNRSSVPIVKEEYFERLVLLTTPLIFSKRVRPTRECPSSTAQQWLAAQHLRVIASKCAPPYVCEPEVLSNPQATMTCTEEGHTRESFFGLDPIDFNGLGWADLLYTITDAAFVSRAGEVRDTSKFVDSLTQSVSIILVFFSPQFGITSLMDVTANCDGDGGEFFLETSVQHYSIVEGPRLRLIISLHVLLIATTLVNVAHVIFRENDANHHVKTIGVPQLQERLRKANVAWAIAMGLAVLVGVTLHLKELIESAGFTEQILSDLQSIDWASANEGMQAKKATFFRTVHALMMRMDANERVHAFLNVLLFLCLLRVIASTSIHPRLALLTGTLARSRDDFWHLFMLTTGLLIGFAAIGTWRFGSSIDAFSSLDKSLQTEFYLMFGEFMDGWADSRELQLFIVLWYVLSFLLVLNFLLAIVVESYMEVRKLNMDIVYEEDFISDVVNSIAAQILRWWYKWPSVESVAEYLEDLKTFSVGFKELHDSGAFPSQHSVIRFLSWYRRFSFLEPPVVSNGRVEAGPLVFQRHQAHVQKEDMIADKVEARLARLLGIKIPSFKDLAASGAQRDVTSYHSEGSSSLGSRHNGLASFVGAATAKRSSRTNSVAGPGSPLAPARNSNPGRLVI